MRQGWSWTIAAVLLVATTACTLGTGPEIVARWELVEVDGQPLPATLELAPGSVRSYIRDEIRIDEDGGWERTTVEEITLPGEPVRRVELDRRGTILSEGSALILDFVCNDTAVCVPPDRLRVDGSEAFIEGPAGVESPVVFRYRRR